jgi:hypothetical protein
MDEMLDLAPEEVAVLVELMLRGPQTPGELRGRASRLHPFSTVEEVEKVLGGLASSEGVWRPLAVKLPRQPGRKEARWAHLLAGTPELADAPDVTRPEPAVLAVRAEGERLAALEVEVATLREEVRILRDALEGFRKQFE